MSTFQIILVILAGLWVFGKIIWGIQDRKELDINPNHPSKISSSDFPVGSGSCPSRNGDRHIWDYGSYDNNSGPSSRY